MRVPVLALATNLQGVRSAWQGAQVEVNIHSYGELFQCRRRLLRHPGKSPQGQEDDPAADRNAAGRSNPIRRVYTVFNAKQIDGIPNLEPMRRTEWEVAETGESILRNSGAEIRHNQRDRAFYSRSEDAVHLARQDAFRSAADYYGTALHELAHWSGHPTRLNRQTLNESYRFGDPADFILGLEKSKTVEKAETQLRTETSEHVADFERGSKTVNIVEKETATEHREPVPVAGKRGGPERDQDAKIDAEKILDGEVDGRKAPSDREFEQSLADAERKGKQLLGGKANVYQADTESGKYRGDLLGETDHHVIQKLSPQSAVAHPKHLLPETVQPGQSLVVSYSNGLAQLKPNQVRERVQALSR